MIVVDGDNDATFPMFEVLKGKNGMSLRRNGLGRNPRPSNPTRAHEAKQAATPSPSTGSATTNGADSTANGSWPRTPQKADVGGGHL